MFGWCDDDHCAKKKDFMKNHIVIIVIAAIILDLIAWGSIFMPTFGKRLEIYFFAVGQGDSEMVVMPGNVKLLIDGGPDNGKAAEQLGRVMPWHDRYIDMVMLSHAELDHFGGLMDVVERYDVGVFIYNGEGSTSESFKAFAQMVEERGIPVIILDAGDTITHNDSRVEIISAHGKNKNEGAIVARFTGGGTSALFTGDIGKDTELQLVKAGGIKADIIKIPHHGSKFSSTENFLQAVKPKIAVIGVGKNSYGHPTEVVLERIRRAGAQMFRTDTDGMVQLIIKKGVIEQQTAKGAAER